MVKVNTLDLKKNKGSIYNDLKEFYNRNKGVLYSYQDFEVAGIKEFKVISNKIRQLETYEKKRFSTELIKMIEDVFSSTTEDLSNLEGYITLNPIINYYYSFRKSIKALCRTSPMVLEKLGKLSTDILLNSNSSEMIKFALVTGEICNIPEMDHFLNIYSIHNEYLFYVIKAYENMNDGNKIIFDLAKKAKGYGKVFCVISLQPVNHEIEKWMIEYGAENNVAISELLSYTMLSLNLLEYLKSNSFNEDEVELFSKSFSMLISDFSLDDINNGLEVCRILIELIDKFGKGIYSLYASISIIYAIENLVLDKYREDKSDTPKIDSIHEEVFKKCKSVFKKEFWYEVVSREISNIEIETSVLISCAEKTGYKLKKNEFELLLKRDYNNALLYKYAFLIGNKTIRKLAFKVGLEKLPINEILSGQDELKIDDLVYSEIAHISYFIIIKYCKYEDFKDEYKEINLKALNANLIETRLQAATNLEKFKEELDWLDEEIINDAISREMIPSIRRKLNLLLEKNNNKEKRYIDIRNIEVNPHIKDIYLELITIAGTNSIDMSEVKDTLNEDEIVYLNKEENNIYDENAIQILTTKGYLIGYIPKGKNSILRNLLDNQKFLYGIVESISDNYEIIKVKIYLSYKDVVDEISTTIALLSKEDDQYIQ